MLLIPLVKQWKEGTSIEFCSQRNVKLGSICPAYTDILDNVVKM